ncbi:alpha-amylase family protein [Phycicoccus sp. MQZ13P-5]|uniref:Alpha-amylase family protein n=1 Tax=Phycicoccus sonneratiae TaxID=2807628 RepID=A0ABS2CLM8_9MICO|nr:alpha-amylase family protein [Phycicoccus sonneraticus]
MRLVSAPVPPPPAVPTADLGAERAEMLRARVERWWPDLHGALSALYGAERADRTGAELVGLAARAFARRPDRLHRRDLDRMLRPDWLQEPAMVGYAAYTERFAEDLHGVGQRLDYLEELGVTYLHLMPLLRPRDGDNDGGYAVADYRQVRPDLGTMADLTALADSLHERGMSLVLDLVLNHVAREHEWARRAREGTLRYRSYFHIFPDRRLPDAYERTLPEVFPDFAPGNFTWDEDLRGWVWTTFNEWQWDVNWGNPDVLTEYAQIVLDLANRGVDVLRLDAIAFMWKRLGTDCQGQPEVHAITQALRAVTRMACPAVAFKAEAIVAPTKLLAYLGQGEHTGKVSDLAYHNSLMVQVWSMLAARDVRLAAHALGSLPPKPASATWLTYLRCHDDIGWAVMDEDAAAVGVTGPGHRHFLADWYSGDFWGSSARGLVFQFNPDTGDRRTSGTAASLVGLEAAETPEEVDEAAAALRLAHAVVLGWGGIPVLWSGDELGQPNDPAWAEEPGHEDDNRWAHRPRLDWSRAAARHDPSTVAGRVFGDLVALVRARASLPHLHASVETRIGPVDDPGVLVTLRDHPLGRMAGVYNVTPEPRVWPGWRVHELGLADAVDAVTGSPLPWGPDGDVHLPPYAALWLTTPTR